MQFVADEFAAVELSTPDEIHGQAVKLAKSLSKVLGPRTGALAL